MTYRVGMCSHLTLCIEDLFCGKKNEDYFGDVIKNKKSVIISLKCFK